MQKHKPTKPRPIVPAEPDPLMDFDAAAHLRNVVSSRPNETGITIDPRGTHIIDDGLWIRPLSTGWVIKTHIADVPSVIPDNNIFEQVARNRREEKEIGPHKVQRLFPESFLEKYVSLQEGQTRPAISFRMELDKDFSVKKYKIFRSAFTSAHQCDYRPLRAQLDISRLDANAWKDVAHGLNFARQKSLADEGDFKISGQDDVPRIRGRGTLPEEVLARTLIHEVMLLTNNVAAEFFKARNQQVPSKVRGVFLEETVMTPDFDFDQVCNRLCWKVLTHLDSQKASYSRLTSPMRNFRDYVTLKIMGKLLAKQEIGSELGSDVVNFTEKFNRVAEDNENFMLSPRWKGVWSRRLKEQRGGHSFDRAAAYRGETTAGNLSKLCQLNNWPRPLVAERTLMLQGTSLYFVGMSFRAPSGQGRDRQTWAVSRDSDMALEIASHRMLRTLKDIIPAMKPGKIEPV